MINIRKSRSRKTWNQQGITLLELLVTLAIIAILATIAYPSYLNQVRKSKRTVAKSALLDAANREEQYYFSNRSYTSKLKVDLNYPEDPQCFNDQQAQIACGGADTVYEMTAAVTRLRYRSLLHHYGYTQARPGKRHRLRHFHAHFQ